MSTNGQPQLGLRPLARLQKKSKSPSFKQRVPVLLLAALSLYGIWFLYAAQSSTSSNRQLTSAAAAEADASASDQAAAAAASAAAAAGAAAAAEGAAERSGGGTAVEASAGRGPSAAAASADGGCTAPPAGTPALGFPEGAHLDLGVHSSAVTGGASAYTLSAWVRLAESERTPEKTRSIQTIFASKASGCDVDGEHKVRRALRRAPRRAPPNAERRQMPGRTKSQTATKPGHSPLSLRLPNLPSTFHELPSTFHELPCCLHRASRSSSTLGTPTLGR